MRRLVAGAILLAAGEQGRDALLLGPDGEIGLLLEYGRAWERLEVMPPRMTWEEWEAQLPPWDEGAEEGDE